MARTEIAAQQIAKQKLVLASLNDPYAPKGLRLPSQPGPAPSGKVRVPVPGSATSMLVSPR